MLHNKIILDIESKNLLKSKIKEVHYTKNDSTIRISFIKKYPGYKYDLLIILPVVLVDIVCSYTNDILLFDVELVLKHTFNDGYSLNVVCLNITPITNEVMLYDVMYDLIFSIYCYPACNIIDYNSRKLNYNVHLGLLFYNYNNNIIEYDKDCRSFILSLLNDYMSSRYKKINYYNNIHHSPDIKFITIKNHKLMKHLCIFVKILLNILSKTMRELN